MAELRDIYEVLLALLPNWLLGLLALANAALIMVIIYWRARVRFRMDRWSLWNLAIALLVLAVFQALAQWGDLSAIPRQTAARLSSLILQLALLQVNAGILWRGMR